tara:strand:- start:4645 stop:7032 length:2388 start_codon:yes stop_codon:yes gene_type:complete
MKILSSIIAFISLFFLSSNVISQTLTTPVAEGVYGGQILDIESWEFDTDSVYVTISTQSPNSIFIGKGYRNSSMNNLNFSVLESAGSDDGYGDNVENIEIHESSNTIYFLTNGSVYQTGINSSSATLIDDLVKNFIIQGDTMCLVKNNIVAGGNDTIVFGPLDPSGNFTPTNGFSLLKKFMDPPQLVISPSDNKLHLFDRGVSPQRQYIDDAFNTMTNSSLVLSALYAAPTSYTNINWRTFGIYDDGSIYITGQPPLNDPEVTDRRIAWSYDNGINWYSELMNGPGPKGGVVGSNIIIEDIGSERHLYCGNLFLTDTNDMNTWFNPGKVLISELNRANDGKTLADPIDQDIKYHTTNIGFGYSTSAGDNIYGWNEGIEAVQVNDIDMNPDFSLGWVASKSGVRKVENYNTPGEIWHPTYFPNLDGSPYLSVAIDTFDNNIVFVGNQRIYRTTNGGTDTGSDDGWEQVFTPEISPYNFSRINTKCNAIAISKFNNNVILAGFSESYSNKGGAFYSLDGGTTWDQLLLNSTSKGNDVDINDIELTEEGGNVVAYLGAESYLFSGAGYGIYRAELASGSWTVTQEPGFSVGDNIIDLEMNIARDSLIVLYRDPLTPSKNQILFKDITTGAWSSTSNGPLSNTNRSSAITIGDGYMFLAIDEKIYTRPISLASLWTLAYSYPVGIDINVLFYDELLVGTSTGLYAHELDLTNVGIGKSPFRNQLTVNYNQSSGKIDIQSDHLINEIRLYDMNGKLVTSAFPKQSNFSFSAELKSGIYILNSTGEKGEIYSNKINVTQKP